MDNMLGMGLLISLKDAFTQNAARIRGSVAGLDANMTAAAQSITRSTNHITGGLKMMGAGVGAMVLPTALIASTLETQRALGALSAEGVNDLKVLDDAATQFTNNWAGYTKPQFLNAAWEIKGALSQLSDQAVGTATAMTALTAKATRGDLAGMSTAMANSFNIFRDLNKEMNDQGWFSGFSAAMTQTVNLFSTDGNRMALALRNLNNSGSALQVPMAEQMATLGALQNVFAGEMGGTNLRAFYENALKGSRELNFNVMDGNRLLPITKILENIKARFGDLADPKVGERIKNAFGDEAKGALLGLLKYADQLPGSIASIQAAFNKGAPLTAEVARKADANIAGLLGVWKNRFTNAGESAGNAVGLWAAPFVKQASEATLAAGQFIDNNQALVGGLLAVPSAFGAALVAAGAARFAIGGLTYSFTALRIGIASARTAWAGFSLVATLSNPVGWAIAGIAAGLAGLTVAWRTNFAGIRDITHNAFSKLALLRQGIKEYQRQIESGKPMDAKLQARLDTAGLLGPAATMGGITYRLQEGLRSLSSTLSPQLRDAFKRASDSAGGFLGRLDKVLAMVLGVNKANKDAAAQNSGKGMADGWRELGKNIGMVGGVAAQSAGFVYGKWMQIGGALATVIGYGNRAVLTVMRTAGSWLSQFWGVARSALTGISEYQGRALAPFQRFAQEFHTLIGGLSLGFGEILGGRGFVAGLKNIGDAIWKYLCSPLRWAMDTLNNTRSLLSKIPGLGWIAPTVEAGPAPPTPQIMSRTAATVTQNNAPVVSRIQAAPRPQWYSPVPMLGRAAAVAALSVTPVWHAPMAAPSEPVTASTATSEPVARSHAWPRPEPIARAGRQGESSEQNAILRALLEEMRATRAATEGLVDRPIEVQAQVMAMLDGREIHRSVQNQQRLSSVRGYGNKT